MLISERILELVKEKGLSQKEFAQRTGIPQSTISDWKGKKVNPASDKILIICDVLGCTPYDVLGSPEGKKKRYQKADQLVVTKGSDEYLVVEMTRMLKNAQRQRLLGYLEALTQKKN